MRALLLPVQESLGVSQRLAVLLVLASLGGLVLGVSIAIRSGLLLEFTGVAFVLLVFALSLRWPLLALFAFVALIPIEEVIRFGEIGTPSRIAGLLFAVAYGIPRLGRLTLRAMPPVAWAYVAFAVLSLGWALDPDATGDALQTMIQLFAVAVLVADVVVHRPTIVRPLLWVYSLSAALTALIGVQALLTGGIASGERIAAFQDQDVAQFAAILLPALVFSLFELLKGRLILLSGAVALVCTAGVVLSGTRGAWLSLVVVAVLFILPRFRRGQQVAAVVVALLLLAVTLQLPGTAELVAERADVAISSGGSGRTDIWSVGMGIFGSAPVAGVGFANFPIAFTSEQVRAAAVTSEIGTGRGPHSIIIGALGELGLIGFTLLALFVLPLVMRRGWGPEAPAVQAALASLMTAALFLDVISNRKQVWLVLGLAAGLAYLRGQHEVPVALPRTGDVQPSVQPAPARPMLGTSPQPPSRALP